MKRRYPSVVVDIVSCTISKVVTGPRRPVGSIGVAAGNYPPPSQVICWRTVIIVVDVRWACVDVAWACVPSRDDSLSAYRAEHCRYLACPTRDAIPQILLAVREGCCCRPRSNLRHTRLTLHMHNYDVVTEIQVSSKLIVASLVLHVLFTRYTG